jgi:hypothetical protein
LTHLPDEGCQFACDGGTGDGSFLSASNKSSIATAQPNLGTPCDIAHLFLGLGVRLFFLFGDARWETVAPCRLD